MDVVFEGSLSRSWSMKDVLQAVTEQDVHLSVLRIASKETDSAGRIAIADNQFIVGACTDTGETGYPAVKDILSIEDGSFTLLDSGSDHPSDLKDVLHLSLFRVIEALPRLPEDPGDLFDQGSLLDMLFGGKEPPAVTAGDVAVVEESAGTISGGHSFLSAAGTDSQDEALDAMQALIAKRSTEEQSVAPLTPLPEFDIEGYSQYSDEISDTISHPAASSEESWNEAPALRMALNAIIIVSLLTSIIFGWPTFIKGMESLRMHGSVPSEPTGS